MRKCWPDRSLLALRNQHFLKDGKLADRKWRKCWSKMGVIARSMSLSSPWNSAVLRICLQKIVLKWCWDMYQFETRYLFDNLRHSDHIKQNESKQKQSSWICLWSKVAVFSSLATLLKTSICYLLPFTPNSRKIRVIFVMVFRGIDKSLV